MYLGAQRRVKTWLDQPARKERRREARKAKAAAIAPRPTAGSLRPVVRCPTVKYHTRVREGRGFTLDELKAAGIAAKVAPTIGIAVDHRRKNRSEEGFRANVARLAEYKSRLVVLPRRPSKPKAGDAPAADVAAAKQLTGEIIPIVQVTPKVTYTTITDAMRNTEVVPRLRAEHKRAKTWGMELKKAKQAAEEAAGKKPAADDAGDD
jgi:large subunit ribosomal protein L13e